MGYADSDCERCGRAFESVFASMLTFTQQIVAGDSWGVVTLPIIEAHPWTAVFFVSVLVSIQLGLMNLILSVIVDKAQQAHADDARFVLQQRQEEFERAKHDLLKMCQKLDQDESGNLSEEELLYGFDHLPAFNKAMRAIDVRRTDIHSLFKVLDHDKSGSVDYEEFCEQLHKMKSQDIQLMMVFLRTHLNELEGKIDHSSEIHGEICSQLQSQEAKIGQLLGALGCESIASQAPPSDDSAREPKEKTSASMGDNMRVAAATKEPLHKRVAFEEKLRSDDKASNLSIDPKLQLMRSRLTNAIDSSIAQLLEYHLSQRFAVPARAHASSTWRNSLAGDVVAGAVAAADEDWMSCAAHLAADDTARLHSHRGRSIIRPRSGCLGLSPRNGEAQPGASATVTCEALPARGRKARWFEGAPVLNGIQKKRETEPPSFA